MNFQGIFKVGFIGRKQEFKIILVTKHLTLRVIVLLDKFQVQIAATTDRANFLKQMLLKKMFVRTDVSLVGPK